MAVHVDNSNFTGIGRMYARNNVAALYDRQKSAIRDDEQTGPAQDMVFLSSSAPRPLESGLFTDAMKTADAISNGSKISQGVMDRLREDRVFRAVSALAALGIDNEQNLPLGWPGGLPAPTGAELEEARRRLAQRLRMQTDEDGQRETVLQEQRAQLVDKLRSRDFSTVGQMTGAEA